MKKMISRSYTRALNINNEPQVFESGETLIYYYKPEISHGEFAKFGLDSEVHLGKADLESLGYPRRIKVVIHVLDR